MMINGEHCWRCERHRARRGSVLLVALWVLVFLSSLAVAVNARVNGMIRFARFLRNERTAYEAARSGVDRAMATVLASSEDWDGWMDDNRFRDVLVGKEGQFSVTYAKHSADGSVHTGYGVVGEESKVNINRAAPVLLAALFQGVGELEAQAAQTLAQRIIDARVDGEPAVTGRRGLPYASSSADGQVRPPGPFESLHELLLIDGMTRDIFEPLQPYMTLYGNGRINLNSAAPAVLMALAESTDAGDVAARASLIQKLARYREAGFVFKDASETAIIRDLEAVATVSARERTVLRAMLGGATLQSSFFGGVAEGRSGAGVGMADAAVSGQVTRRIAFVIDRQGMARVDWHEF